jgi:hypothetical protein
VKVTKAAKVKKVTKPAKVEKAKAVATTQLQAQSIATVSPKTLEFLPTEDPTTKPNVKTTIKTAIKHPNATTAKAIRNRSR